MKNFGRATSRPLVKRVAAYLGDFTNFPRNNIVSFHYHQKLWKNISLRDLEVHNKSNNENNLSPIQSLFKCCIEPPAKKGSEKILMVSKFLHCKITDYSLNVEEERFAELFRTFAEMIMETEISDVVDVSQLILKKVKTDNDVNEVAIQALEFLDSDCDEIHADHREILKNIITAIYQEKENELLLISEFFSKLKQLKGLDGEFLFKAFSTCVEDISKLMDNAHAATPLTAATLDPNWNTLMDDWKAHLEATASLLEYFILDFNELKNLINSDWYCSRRI